MSVVHKKRPTRWHRDGHVAPCGVIVIKRKPLYKSETVAPHSYFWRDVTCEECIQYKEVVKIDYLNKFREIRQ